MVVLDVILGAVVLLSVLVSMVALTPGWRAPRDRYRHRPG